MLPNSTQDRTVQPYMLAELRFPRHPEIPARFAGNCVQELAGGYVSDPANLAAVCGEMHAASNLVRGPAAQAVLAKAFDAKMHHLAIGVLPAIGASTTIHRYQLNAKQSFRVLDLTFGAGPCFGHIPVNAGSDMQIVEAHGGVHVYLGCPSWAVGTAPSNWIATVETTAFRNRILTMPTDSDHLVSVPSPPPRSIGVEDIVPEPRAGLLGSNMRQLRVHAEQLQHRAMPGPSLLPKSKAFCTNTGKPYHKAVKTTYDAEISTPRM
jgi:hypothetical protein